MENQAGKSIIGFNKGEKYAQSRKWVEAFQRSKTRKKQCETSARLLIPQHEVPPSPYPHSWLALFLWHQLQVHNTAEAELSVTTWGVGPLTEKAKEMSTSPTDGDIQWETPDIVDTSGGALYSGKVYETGETWCQPYMYRTGANRFLWSCRENVLEKTLCVSFQLPSHQETSMWRFVRKSDLSNFNSHTHFEILK